MLDYNNFLYFPASVFTMVEKDNTDEIISRLDSIIGILVENMVVSGLIGKGRAIEILYTSGLGPTQIGKIFGLPPTSIGSIVSRQEKQKKASRKKS
jgi:hypothetical protein